MANVSFNNESLGNFSEVRYHFRDVTLGDVLFCGDVLNIAEHGLTRAAGRK